MLSYWQSVSLLLGSWIWPCYQRSFLTPLKSCRSSFPALDLEKEMTQIQFLRMLGELGADEHGRRFMCPICGKEYDKVKTLHWHIKQQHMRARFKCMECGKEYMENYRLEEHIKTVHLGQEYQCPYERCKRKYQAKKSLDNHIAIHKKEFLFQCEICDRGFRHKVQFEGHMNKHYGIKPYECATCGRCYTHGVDLTRHVKICGKGKTEKCTFCNKAFMYKKNVLQHVKKVHESTGPDSFLCSTCGRDFVSRNALNGHLQTHRSDAK